MAAKNKFLNAMKMPSIDDMFSSEADRQRESGDLVTEVSLSELHPFVGHPFEVRDDEDMQKLVDSIRENGVLTNLTVRRRTEGGYEIISGHRRFHAAQRAGLTAVKVQVRDIDDDQAIIDMVDSNIQREHISPMEKARAYAIKLEAISRQGARRDLTSAQVGRKLESADIVGKEAGDYTCEYRFTDYDYAQSKLKATDYRCAYVANMPRDYTPDKCFRDFNYDDRPCANSMPSLSVSDLIVMDRDDNSKVFHINQAGLSQPLALALNQTRILFQLEHQAAGLLVGTAQGLHDFLGGEDDVDPALFIQPVILDRKAHAVQQDTIQDLCIGGQRFELRVCEQHLGDTIE